MLVNTKMKIPKVFCIGLKNHPVSEKLLNECLLSAKRVDSDIEIFWGVNGKEIDLNIWKNLKILPPQSKKFRASLGMQGCFLSHFLLWKKSLEANEPLIILEHDAILIESLKDFEDNNFDLLKLHKPTSNIRFNHDTGYWNFGTHGYYIKPSGAEKLISWVIKNYPYNPDILIGTRVLNWKNLDKDIVSINEANISTTTNIL
jgi:GR25 family glycosyltransferase involved in LPS biosynthesis